MKLFYISCKRYLKSKFTRCLDHCQSWLNIKKEQPQKDPRALYIKGKDEVIFEGGNMHYGEENAQNTYAQNLIMKSNIKGVHNV